MKADGATAFFVVQHEDSGGRWCDSALDHMFDGLTYTDRNGELGDRYRALLVPQGASSALWQLYGVNGFRVQADGEAALAAVRERRPGQRFRLARRVLSRSTTVVST